MQGRSSISARVGPASTTVSLAVGGSGGIALACCLTVTVEEPNCHLFNVSRTIAYRRRRCLVPEFLGDVRRLRRLRPLLPFQRPGGFGRKG